MSLPEHWTNKIFEKLMLTYGRDFLARWEGVPIADLKADWAHELAGYVCNAPALAYALQNLPTERPPTVLQFRAICQRAPAPAVPRIEPPKANPEVARKAIAEARALLNRLTNPVQE